MTLAWDATTRTSGVVCNRLTLICEFELKNYKFVICEFSQKRIPPHNNVSAYSNTNGASI